VPHVRRNPSGEDVMLLFPRLLTKANSQWLRWTYPFAGFGNNVSIHYSCEIRKFYSHKIRIGDSIILDPDVWLNVPLVSEGDEAAIQVGNGSRIGRRSVISAINHIELQEKVLLAPSVYITDHNHEYSDIDKPIVDQGVTSGGRIIIERNCWLGYGCMILGTKGDLVIGRNSVIGAYAVVTGSCPPYSVVAGNPAYVVKEYDHASGKWVKVDRHQDRDTAHRTGVLK
jgi:acetyltransferase-like isoleucine patch superfamily enzyme